MGQAPAATVVVLNYNYARFLRRSLDSALAQTWPNVEVAVVDDCSTDESRDVIAGYGARVRPVLQPRNGGHGAGMNAGFAAAAGEVVFFLDADDFLYPTAVERVMERRRPDAAQYQRRLDLVDAEGRPFDTYPARETAWEDGDVVPALLAKGRYATTVTSGLAFERRVLEAILPMDPEAFRQGGDGYLATAAPFYGSVVTLDETLGAYCQHGVNHSQSAIGARASWRVLHDERRYEALRAHAARRGLAVAGDLGRNDPIYLEERAAALLLNEAAAAAKDRRELARAAVRAMRAAPVSARRRAMLGAWWLVVGYAPLPPARRVLAWKLQAATRPAVVRRLARLARTLGGVPTSPGQPGEAGSVRANRGTRRAAPPGPPRPCGRSARAWRS
jgi:GT2 family glycosyltransferase